jgi:lipoprotein-anchoring transpeptidase ErfK/SrfK
MTAPSPTSRYEEVLARAVAAMPTNANERRATYDRVRAALVARLRAINPPVPEVAIEAEQAALEAAIQRVETRFAEPAADTMDLPPETPHVLHERRRGILLAVVGGTAAILALLIGVFAYQHGRDIGRSALRGLRQATVTPKDSSSPARNSGKQATAPVPYIFMRQLVPYRSTNPAGTVVIDKDQRYLYVILKNVSAVRYGIALGENCVEAAGRYTVSRKLGPDGSQSLQAVPAGMPPGNRALYLDSDVHLIHGTERPSSIGQSVGGGCFLLIPTDLAELYGRVPVGTRVVVN